MVRFAATRGCSFHKRPINTRETIYQSFHLLLPFDRLPFSDSDTSTPHFSSPIPHTSSLSPRYPLTPFLFLALLRTIFRSLPSFPSLSFVWFTYSLSLTSSRLPPTINLSAYTETTYHIYLLPLGLSRPSFLDYRSTVLSFFISRFPSFSLFSSFFPPSSKMIITSYKTHIQPVQPRTAVRACVNSLAKRKSPEYENPLIRRLLCSSFYCSRFLCLTLTISAYICTQS